MARCPENCTCNRHKSKGMRRDPEIGRRISASKMGHTVSAEARKKIGDATRGRRVSPETRALMSQAQTRHGHNNRSRRSPEYRTWDGMKQRCFNPNAAGYENYGGRGITVCERWMTFENFLADMGVRPGTGRQYSLDRVDGNGPYSPENCRWATASEQQKNRPNFNPRKAKKCPEGCACRKHSWRTDAQ